MERTIDEVARLTGLSTRALRHYGDVGLIAPSGVGAGGRRRYDETALVRLQRALLMRDLGMALTDIRAVLDRAEPAVGALERHLATLRDERGRVERRIRAVEATVTRLRRGEPLVAEEMFDGFDSETHRAEVEERWGPEAWATGDAWWRPLGDEGRAAFRERQRMLEADWRDASARGIRPDSEEAQDLVAAHIALLAEAPGAPTGGQPLRGLGGMYVADDRFSRRYGGVEGAALVRDALHVWVDAHG